MVRRRWVGVWLACVGCGAPDSAGDAAEHRPNDAFSLADADAVPISPQGRRALETVAQAHAFGASSFGAAGTPTTTIVALRTLADEPEAAKALLFLVRHGTLPAQLLGLAALRDRDPVAFEREVEAFRHRRDLVPVLRNGCDPTPVPTKVADLVERPDAVRLEPRQTLTQWAQGHPGRPAILDLVGGGYSADLLGARSPADPP